MTELAAPQISSLMEALPGIAAVLRSPVATAIVDLIRAGVGLRDFRLEDAEELLKFGVRRNLLDEAEAEQVLAEVREAVGKSGKKQPEPRSAAPKPKPVPQPPRKPAPLRVASSGKPAQPPPKAPPPKAAAKPVAKKAATKKAAPAPRKAPAKKAAPKKAPAHKAAAKKAAPKKTAPRKGAARKAASGKAAKKRR